MYIQRLSKESILDTAKVFPNGGSQAIRLPKEYRFDGAEEVIIKKHGEVVYLFPKSKAWEVFVESLDLFTDDFMAEGREQPEAQERSWL